MNDWGILAGLGLLSSAATTVAYVRYRRHESSSLLKDVELARGLRELAAGDPVRLASVDEFEVGVYRRLFYVSAVGPRLRSAAWALLAALLAAVGTLLFERADGTTADVFWIVALLAAVCFGLAALVFLALAAFTAATTPRVSFAESSAGDDDAADTDG
ncbi:MAG: hypothetical protein QM809_02945 [Gordonia sp. (in: high G+C Gram-positive bacteria)]|uniref:hypothetical protein n=1 Tax=Gordonia sp. (in: high G+C Gram-positive bacteria) TaxID=84139 RepID=UPI0039E41A15